MDNSSNFKIFLQNLKNRKSQLVWSKIVADMETPITASFKLKSQKAPFFLLESVEGGSAKGRYSIIGVKPDIIWQCDESKAKLMDLNTNKTTTSSNIFASFRKLLERTRLEIPNGLPPMAAGLIGYMSYDAIRFIEPSVPDSNPDVIGIPVGLFMRPTIMLIFDSVNHSLYVCTPVWETKGDAQKLYREAKARINKVKDKLRKTYVSEYQAKNFGKKNLAFNSTHTPEDYYNMVEKAKEYILAGDIFQVVPSQRMKAKFDISAFAFYRSLRHLNPSPFLFYLNFGDFQLVGSSPEILVRLRDNKVTIRPLAGTRKRGKNPTEDEALARELLADTKEISEHLMLIDLSRNDVGKVAKPGTVKVTEKMIIEYYSHVMHISSNVEGELASGYDALDALFAGLPVGTVSGAPKIRAMQIIDELENEKRSFYAGCVGYFSANGSMDTCITLRTGLVKDGTLYIQAGGGIVAESDPVAEYQESCNKAKALQVAAERSIRFINPK
ncbi:anthranilate synthase component I [Candidatus Margulisiibacteriota bacterium]